MTRLSAPATAEPRFGSLTSMILSGPLSGGSVSLARTGMRTGVSMTVVVVSSCGVGRPGSTCTITRARTERRLIDADLDRVRKMVDTDEVDGGSVDNSRLGSSP